VLVAWPSVPALKLLLAAYGFEIEIHVRLEEQAGRPTAHTWSHRLREEASA